MTDRELLELAAKAAGWTGWRSKHGYWNVTSPEGKSSTHCHYWDAYCPDTGVKLREPTFADAIAEANWNPLTDDGDALRLAVKLEISVRLDLGNRIVVAKPPALYQVENEEIHYDESKFGGGCDPYAATRRAIVRAAAEIGRSQI